MALMQTLLAPVTAQAVYVAARLEIADRLAVRSKSAGELAAECDADADALYRVLRCLAATGVLTEDSAGRFATTELGELLRDDAPGGLRHTALIFGAETFRAFTEIMHSVRTGEPGFDAVYGRPFYDHLAAHPAVDRSFDRVVAETNRPVRDLVVSLDLSGRRHLVDLGGRHGALLAEILAANPQLSGTLLELPETAREATERLAVSGLETRLRVLAGDFFAEVPVEGDTYLLARCLHNWDDENAVRILRTVRAAMDPGDRLLIVERPLPSPGVFGIGKIFDLVMLVALGGRERTLDEYQALLEKASLMVAGMSPGEGGITLIEATARLGDPV